MDTSNLKDGLELFIIGFGGVFANLALVYVAISLTGYLVRRAARRQEQAEKTGTASGQ